MLRSTRRGDSAAARADLIELLNELHIPNPSKTIDHWLSMYETAVSEARRSKAFIDHCRREREQFAAILENIGRLRTQLANVEDESKVGFICPEQCIFDYEDEICTIEKKPWEDDKELEHRIMRAIPADLASTGRWFDDPHNFDSLTGELAHAEACLKARLSKPLRQLRSTKSAVLELCYQIALTLEAFNVQLTKTRGGLFNRVIELAIEMASGDSPPLDAFHILRPVIEGLRNRGRRTPESDKAYLPKSDSLLVHDTHP